MPSLSTIRDYGVPIASQVVGGYLNRRAAGSATRNLTSGVRRSMDTLNAGYDSSRRTLADVYDEQKKLLNPYAAAGTTALDTLKTGTAPGGDFVKPFDASTFELYKDPGYNWRVEQGNREIRQEGNAGGIRFSGATLKALSQFNQESASQEYGAARGRAVDDQTRAYTRTLDQANLGLRGTEDTVSAGSQYGTNLSRLQADQAQQLADLETDLASAQAMGDMTKAATITDTINSILSTVNDVGLGKSVESLIRSGANGLPQVSSSVRSVADLVKSLGPTAAAASTAAGLGGAGAVSLPALAGEISSVTGVTAGGAAGGGLASTLGALATNPITLAAAGALGVGLLWRKSQAHRTANEWVQGTQNDFDTQMAGINENPQLDAPTKQQLQQIVVKDYLAAAIDFMQKHGGKGREVIGNAMRTLRQWYPQFASQAVA